MRYRLVSLLLVLVSALNAQFSGRLAGTVMDASSAPVAGAAVSLRLPNSDKVLLSTRTAADGSWRLIGVRPADYDLSFEAAGFAKTTLRAIAVDPARETTVQPVTLQLPAVTQSVDVAGDAQTVQTSNAEISSTITMEQIDKLPIIDRDPLALIQTLPGVVFNGNSDTTINGLRTSYSNMTLDGINIQDNYIRDNALDYTPNRLLVGQVREMTLVTSNQNSAASGGATQLAFETPSGTNTFHGSAYWYNRNNDFAANDWFNNQAGVAQPRLNQNQMGGSIGGPIKKDKLFFFSNYEAVRTNQQLPQDTTILTTDARNGIFTYQPRGQPVQKVNLLALAGTTIDPYMAKLLQQVPAASFINNFDVGDSSPALLKNAAGYRFNQRDNEVRDNVTGRIDYNLSTRHVFTGSYLWNRDNVDRPDLELDFSPIPRITNPNHSHFLSLGWRWTPTATITNELRGGFNLAPGDFTNSQQFGQYLITGMLFTDPVTEPMPQGRATNTYSISDNASWQKGRHFIQFGFHMQQVRVHSYDDSGIVPTYNVAMGTGQNALTRNDLAGISAADLTTANQLLATLGGYIDSYSQTLNVTSRTSGFVSGAGNVRNFRQSENDFYIQDNWKLRPRIAVNVGLRWDLPGVVDERDSLELLPVIQNHDPVQTLLSNATLNFAGASVGHPWYNRDWKNFAPNVGLAWDVFGDGKTAFRAGYGISYVNDAAIVAAETMAENEGLIGIAAGTGLSGQVSNGRPSIVLPPYQVPLTDADNYANDPLNTVGLINPNLRTPYVQQYSAGIQHEFLRTVFEARYVGNHMVGGFRTFDYNQVIVQQNGFLGDFINAENNGNLAFQRNGIFNPAYNASIPGSQPLPVFAKLFAGGMLTNGTIRNLIQTGQAGALAATYQENGLNGSVNFFANPNALGTDLLTNYSNSTYNSLQVEARHRATSGLEFTANYTFSKVLSDTAGDSSSRIEHFLDLSNPGLDRARANFDLTHSIKGTAVYTLPFGKDHRLHYRPLNRVIEGWSLGGIMSWQSGAPFSILSGYGTLNRADGGRSYYNTADTALTMGQLSNVVKFQMTGNGPYMVAQSAINPDDGTGTSTLGSPAYTGEVFTNPGAGTLGTLQRRMFSGPWSFDLDMSLQRRFRITERQSIELRMEGTNILNHPTFYVGDQSINSTQFGVISSTLNLPRIMQFAARYQF